MVKIGLPDPQNMGKDSKNMGKDKDVLSLNYNSLVNDKLIMAIYIAFCGHFGGHFSRHLGFAVYLINLKLVGIVLVKFGSLTPKTWV